MFDLSDEEAYVKSQEHLCQPNAHNPLPVVVPPPIQTLASHHIRHRVVLSVIGLPLRGQAHIAARLKHYLDFFHGAHTSLFNLNDFVGRRNADEEILEALRRHFEEDGNSSKRHAILYTTNSLQATGVQWSGHSKGRRRWMSTVLREELGAELHVVEIQVHQSLEHNSQYIQRHKLARVFETPDDLESHISLYRQRFVTIQEDGSEDHLHYIKVINYNSKVLTCNMMNTFLGSRVARFMANVHPYRHVLYLSRVGESEFHLQHRIGGDAPLSPNGQQYALRLAEFANFVVDKQHEGFACVSFEHRDPQVLRGLLVMPFTEMEGGGGIFACGDWSGFAGGAKVEPGMQLRRIQRGPDRKFEDAPHSIQELVEFASDDPLTLIFSNQGANESQQVHARLWTSALLRAKQTIANINQPEHVEGQKVWKQLEPREYRNLNEQYAGEYEGLTIDEIKSKQPHEVELRSLDRLGYRYPRGESLLDVIARLEDMIQHLESYQEPLLIVAHGPVLRFLWAYVKGIPREEATEINIPDHSVIKVTFDGATGLTEEIFPLGPFRHQKAEPDVTKVESLAATPVTH